MNMARDREIREIVGQSPNAGAIQAAVQAHIAEHILSNIEVK